MQGTNVETSINLESRTDAGPILVRWGLFDKCVGQAVSYSLGLYRVQMNTSVCRHIQVSITGELVRSPPAAKPFGAYTCDRHLTKIHEILYIYAKSLGVKMGLGKAVSSFFEDGECGVGGVTTTDGEVYEADPVIAGPRTGWVNTCW